MRTSLAHAALKLCGRRGVVVQLSIKTPHKTTRRLCGRAVARGMWVWGIVCGRAVLTAMAAGSWCLLLADGRTAMARCTRRAPSWARRYGPTWTQAYIISIRFMHAHTFARRRSGRPLRRHYVASQTPTTAPPSLGGGANALGPLLPRVASQTPTTAPRTRQRRRERMAQRVWLWAVH
jgi:hypothetical protein